MSSTLKVRVKIDGQTTILSDLNDKITLRELKDEIAKRANADWYHIIIKAGFPPKEVVDSDSTGVQELKLHQEVLMIIVDKTRPEPESSSSASSPKKRPSVEGDDSGSNKRAKSPSARQAHLDPILTSSGFIDRIDKKLFPEPPVFPADFLTNFRRQIIVSDNSCLFNSIIDACQLRVTAAQLRKVVAQAIEIDDRFNAAVLEKHPKEYARWIQKSDSWGGYIECLILAEYLQIQIASVHIQTGHVAYYPEKDEYKGDYRIILLHDGIHYDFVLADGPENIPMRIFSVHCEMSLAKAGGVARTLKEKKQFTDVHGFAIQCQECFTLLKGQKEAQAHGQTTGHRNFAQVG